MRFDPDDLHHRSRCVSVAEDARQRAEHREMHARWLARNGRLLEHDRRWRRRAQTALGALAAVVAGLAGTVLYALMAKIDGASLEWFDSAVTSINIGGAATAFTAIRMVLAWRKRRGANPIARTADTVAAVYRP